ncbi:MAG TPA: CRTAC1 family protein [Myxococcota bacterium]
MLASRIRVRCAAALALLLVLPTLGCRDERSASLSDWKTRRAERDATIWADEVLGREYERTLISLWDGLLQARRGRDHARKVEVLASIAFESLTLGTPQRTETLDHGIEIFEFAPPKRTLGPEAWGALVRKLAGDGYRLVQSEWYHTRFSPPSEDAPARSRVAMVLHVIDTAGQRRFIVEGELGVEWSARRDARGDFVPARIDAGELRMLVRAGAPAFRRVLSVEQPIQDKLSPIHPVLLYDLDKDGLLDAVLVRASRVLRNRGGGSFQNEPLLDDPFALMETALTETGVIADLNGDSNPDLLSTRARGDLVLFLGDARGRFPDEPKVTRFEQPLRGPSVLSVGDIDGDRDLDVWLAQYKPPYLGGQMPTPYYDANDGHPAYLLLNDGAGNFTDATEAAGLAERRFRRTYASSFFDLDGDGDLDLLVVSDFAGIDLYHNDGSGHFTDANRTVRGDRHLFGMSASFADYDLDGNLDFFVAGMASPTAQRIHALGLGREDHPEVQAMRLSMAFGNRMYLGGNGGWREPEFSDQIARTGWTWGTTAFDFDNDGDPDLFAANGHVSGESARDYYHNFWCHDVYDGTSEPNEALGVLFTEKMRGLAMGVESWDGHQKNHLLMNRAGKGFVNVAFLMGVADEFDSRSAVSGDLDLDGRVDLVVVEDRATQGQKLHIYRNQLETPNAWIGVRLQEEGGGVSPVGASVVVRTAQRAQEKRIITGDTIMGQHGNTLHFGLGEETRVESIEVRWPDGATRVLRKPEAGHYHSVAPPAEPTPAGGRNG